MITIHHLGVSQSDRVVWLMEELNLPYAMKWYQRGENRLAQEDFLSLHPAATSPVISDGDRVLTESAVILEHICHRHAGGKLTVGPEQKNYEDYLYWMHFNNNLMALFLGESALAGNQSEEAKTVLGPLFERRGKQYYGYLEQRLGSSAYLAGPQFTCADIMTLFSLTTLPLFGGRNIDHLPNARAYVKRLSSRPAYQRAMKIAGPAAEPPSG